MIKYLLKLTKYGRNLLSIIKDGEEAFNSIIKIYVKFEKLTKNQALKKDIRDSKKKVYDFLNKIKDLKV